MSSEPKPFQIDLDLIQTKLARVSYHLLLIGQEISQLGNYFASIQMQINQGSRINDIKKIREEFFKKKPN